MGLVRLMLWTPTKKNLPIPLIFSHPKKNTTQPPFSTTKPWSYTEMRTCMIKNKNKEIDKNQPSFYIQVVNNPRKTCKDINGNTLI